MLNATLRRPEAEGGLCELRQVSALLMQIVSTMPECKQYILQNEKTKMGVFCHTLSISKFVIMIAQALVFMS